MYIDLYWYLEFCSLQTELWYFWKRRVHLGIVFLPWDIFALTNSTIRFNSGNIFLCSGNFFLDNMQIPKASWDVDKLYHPTIYPEARCWLALSAGFISPRLSSSLPAFIHKTLRIPGFVEFVIQKVIKSYNGEKNNSYRISLLVSYSISAARIDSYIYSPESGY